MASFNLEDIQTLRRCSGLSYEEAVALLEYHGGSLARALTDLEESGKLKKDKGADSRATQEKGSFRTLLQKGYSTRLKVTQGEKTVVNVSLLFVLVCLIFAPYLTIFSVVLSLVMGYKVRIETTERAEQTDLEETFRHAADNLRTSVKDLAGAFAEKGAGEEKAAPAPQQETEKPETKRAAGYATAASAYSADVPVLHVPMRVKSADGSMQVTQDGDGYSSATVE